MMATPSPDEIQPLPDEPYFPAGPSEPVAPEPGIPVPRDDEIPVPADTDITPTSPGPEVGPDTP